MARKSSNFNLSKGIVKHFAIKEPQILGMVTAINPITLPDGYCQFCNGFPSLTGALEGYLEPKLVYTPDITIEKADAFNFGDDFYVLICNFSSVATVNTEVIKNFSTVVGSFNFPFNDFDLYYDWLLLVGDSNLVALNLTNGTVRDLTSEGIFGDTITAWKGRIFVGKDDTITYSIPNPDLSNTTQTVFDTTAGAGWIQINTKGAKIKKLLPKEDTIYIFLSTGIHALFGTTISNDPQTWYLTELNSQIGLLDTRAYAISKNGTIYFLDQEGRLNKFVATTPERIDDLVYNIAPSHNKVVLFIYGLEEYIGKPYYNKRYGFYSIITTKDRKNYFTQLLWRKIDADVINYFVAKGKLYFALSNGIYESFAGTQYFIPFLVSKQYDFGDVSIYKNVRKIKVDTNYWVRTSDPNFEAYFPAYITNSDSTPQKLSSMIDQFTVLQTRSVFLYSQPLQYIELCVGLPKVGQYVNFYTSVGSVNWTTSDGVNAVFTNTIFYLGESNGTPIYSNEPKLDTQIEIRSFSVEGTIGARNRNLRGL